MVLEMGVSSTADKSSMSMAIAKDTPLHSSPIELETLQAQAIEDIQAAPYPKGIKLAIIIFSLAASVFLIALVCCLLLARREYQTLDSNSALGRDYHHHSNTSNYR